MTMMPLFFTVVVRI